MSSPNCIGSVDVRGVVACCLLCTATACGEGATKYIGAHEVAPGLDAGAGGSSSGGASGTESGAPPATASCEVGAVPSRLDADSFYTKYADALGIPVLSSVRVSDAAVVQACHTVNRMLAHREDIRAEMIDNGARLAVIAPDQRLHDLPELTGLSSDWNGTRGIGASMTQPLTVATEENLLCFPEDVHRGEVILMHSFAHAMRALGIARLETNFDDRLEAAYEAALFDGKWLDAFASESFPQYWAEGVQSWFDANLSPPNAYHNEINTRAELAVYDPALHSIIADYFPAETGVPDCFTPVEP